MQYSFYITIACSVINIFIFLFLLRIIKRQTKKILLQNKIIEVQDNVIGFMIEEINKCAHGHN